MKHDERCLPRRVTKNRFFVTLFLLIPFQQANADAWQFGEFRNNPGSFLLGLVSGIAIHELGHFVAADAAGSDAEFDGVTVVYPYADLSDQDQLHVASAGFQFQWLASELALRHRHNNHLTDAGNNFSAGIVWAHLGVTAAYLTILRDHEDGDLYGMSQATGLSNSELALLVAIPAVLDAWRLMGADVPDWVPTLSIGSKGLGIVSTWNF